MAENKQKIKLIKLYELLRKETDEDHPMKHLISVSFLTEEWNWRFTPHPTTKNATQGEQVAQSPPFFHALNGWHKQKRPRSGSTFRTAARVHFTDIPRAARQDFHGDTACGPEDI
jgi:hypothetical protein